MIVGAGPTGLALAIQLTRYGVPVRVIEMLAAPSPWSRALGIQARTLEVFERMGVVDRFLAEGLQYREIFVRSNGALIVHESFSKIRSRYNYLLALPQDRTEAILAARLQELGVTVERGTQLVHLQQDAASVRVHVRGPGGETDPSYAYVVGCDGAHSTVRHLLDVPFLGEAISEEFALADVKLDGDVPRDAASVFLSKNNVGAIFPLPHERTRLVIQRAAGFPQAPSIDDFRSVLHAGGAVVRAIGAVTWISHFAISQRRVASVAKGRVFLAGDASHIHSPLGAQGMNTGIQDVENLAWKLALSLHGHGPAAFLASYANEREAVAAALVRMTGSLTKLVLSSNPALRAVRDRVAAFATSIPMVQDRMRDAISELGIVYAKSPIVDYGSHSPDPRPGAHAPDGALRRADGAETSLFELLSTLRHVMLVFTYRRDQFVHELLAEVARHGDVVTPYLVARDVSVGGANLLDPAGLVFRAYGAGGEPQYVLIRPDGYVAARGAVRDYRAVVAFLDRVFAREAGSLSERRSAR